MSTIVTTTEPKESAAAHSRLKNFETKSALEKKTSPGPAPASSGTKPGKTPVYAATVPGLGATLQGPDVCRFCNAPGHRIGQRPAVVYVAGRSGILDDKWCRGFACKSFGHKQKECPSSVLKIGAPSTATAPVGGASV